MKETERLEPLKKTRRSSDENVAGTAGTNATSVTTHNNIPFRTHRRSNSSTSHQNVLAEQTRVQAQQLYSTPFTLHTAAQNDQTSSGPQASYNAVAVLAQQQQVHNGNPPPNSAYGLGEFGYSMRSSTGLPGGALPGFAYNPPVGSFQQQQQGRPGLINKSSTQAAYRKAVSENNIGRSVYIGNLPADASVSELLDLVCFGPLESVRILPERLCAFISFLDGDTAAAFHADVTAKKTPLHSQELKIGWGKASPVSSQVMLGVTQHNASRNVYLGGLDESMTEEQLRNDLSRFGQIEQVKIIRSKNIGFVHFLNISTAITVVTKLPTEPAWTGKRVNYGKDRCGYVPKSRQASAAAEVTPPTIGGRPSSPRVQASEVYDSNDWDVSFQVDEIIYRVHKSVFNKESCFFQPFFDDYPEFIYSDDKAHSGPISIEGWLSMLRLSNRWSMDRIKDHAINRIDDLKKLNAVDKIVIATKEGVEAWHLPAYIDLVEREEPLSVPETNKNFALDKRPAGPVIGMDVVGLLNRAREHFQRSNGKGATAERIVREVFGYPLESQDNDYGLYVDNYDALATPALSEAFPKTSNLCLDGQITDGSEFPVAAGGSSDIWTGYLGTCMVCIKVIRPFSSAGARIQRNKLFKRVWREYLTWSCVSHPNILECHGYSYDFTPNGDLPALISSWMPNGDVNSYLETHPNVDRFQLILGIAEGVSYLHNRKPVIVHGDLRAGNILVSEAGVPSLADFGISRIIGDIRGLTTSSEPAGSLRWMAPELLSGASFSVSSDIWAYGMTVVEIFSGARPYNNLSGLMAFGVITKGEVPSRPATFTDRLWAACQRCWSLQPGNRSPMVEVILELTKPEAAMN